jgi:hypothetical protein
VQGCEGRGSPDGRGDARTREEVGMAPLVGEAMRAVVADVREQPLQHGGRVGGEALVYSRGNDMWGGLTLRGVVGCAFRHFPMNNGSLRWCEEDKRQGRSAGAAVECSCGRDFTRRWMRVVVDLPVA